MNIFRFFIVAAVAAPFCSWGASVSIDGSQLKVIEIKPEANTGLDALFVVDDTKDCTFRISGINGYSASVSRYSNLGGGYAEEIRDIDRSSTSLSFQLSADDMGYIVDAENTRYYCWVINYSRHTLHLDGVSAGEQQCDYSVLNIDGEAGPITYYTINGQPRTLGREIYIDYSTQEFNSEDSEFVITPHRKIYDSLTAVVSINPPAYCPTYFTVSGDRFLREWNSEVEVGTGLVEPYAVNCRVEAVQEDTFGEEGSNIMNGDNNGLGGSAPADISFLAYITDAVIHYEWQMARDPEFENPDYRFYQQNLDYTFNEEGTFYLRFIGSNADGSCETFGDTFTVNIGASALECPNAFSPNGDGVNDMWKVSYRSLTDFHCEIFNRSGQKIYGFDDPSGGWDGTWHGKTVKSGVYYYVITATGADGKKYKKSGDINIINTVNYGSSTLPSDQE